MPRCTKLSDWVSGLRRGCQWREGTTFSVSSFLSGWCQLHASANVRRARSVSHGYRKPVAHKIQRWCFPLFPVLLMTFEQTRGAPVEYWFDRLADVYTDQLRREYEIQQFLTWSRCSDIGPTLLWWVQILVMDFFLEYLFNKSLW